MKFTKLMPILVASLAAGLNAFGAMAQSEGSITPSEAFSEAFSHNYGSAPYNTTIWRQFNAIFGVTSFREGSYPETEIVRDAQKIHELHEELMHEQVSRDPIIRTRDLRNPYDSSLLTNPEYINPR